MPDSQSMEHEYTFANALVKAMTGLSIPQIPEANLHLVTRCLNIYYLYIENYILMNFGKKAYIQLKSIGMVNRKSMSDFPQLEGMYDEAYTNFLLTLKSS